MFDPRALPISTKGRSWHDLAPHADGSRLRLPVLWARGAQPEPRLVVFGAVHGDEYDGPEVIHRVFDQVDAQAMRGTLLMVPVCNVPAYDACARSSPIDGANLARVFPGNREGSITERIAYWLTETFIRGADCLVDIHSGGLAYALPTLAGYTHGVAPLHQASEAIARAFGAPVLWAHPAPLPPGRSLSAADALGVPSMYTEAAGAGRVADDVLACFTRGVMNVMKHLGMLEGAPQTEPLQHNLTGNGDLDQMIIAPCAGHFRASVRLLQPVRMGQRLGAVFDLAGNERVEICANRDGVVITLRGLHRVNSGDGLAHITGEYGQVFFAGEAHRVAT